MNHEEISNFIENNPLCKAALQDHFHNARGLIKSYFQQLDEQQVDAIVSHWLTHRKRKINTPKAPKKNGNDNN